MLKTWPWESERKELGVCILSDFSEMTMKSMVKKSAYAVEFFPPKNKKYVWWSWNTFLKSTNIHVTTHWYNTMYGEWNLLDFRQEQDKNSCHTNNGISHSGAQYAGAIHNNGKLRNGQKNTSKLNWAQSKIA